MKRAGNIYLVGMMGAGKTTVGRLLARRLKLRFVDSDQEIEGRCGVKIPLIFEIEGEGRFRAREAQVLAELTALDGVVIGTGGGAVLSEENRQRLAANGTVVYLRARPEDLYERVRHDRNRPLLATGDPLERLRALYAERDPLYRSIADLTVDTGRQGRQRTGAPAALQTRRAMESLRLELGSRSYPIHIGADLLARADLYRPHLGGGGVAIVTNEVVAPLYLAKVRAGLPGLPVTEIVVPDGEQAKGWQTLDRVLDALLAARFGRDGLLIALGGGVVGDLAGFAAAVYQRGVAFLQVPTTLLAQVDSSVGGKTAINHPRGKNMIGAFHQPRAVIADVAALDTLPDRELRAGLAEVIKHAVALDVPFLEWLEENIGKLTARDRAALTYAVRRCCEIKAGIVASDEREAGQRALLNFGHTFGHAIEAATGYGAWLHGEAIAAGMVMAAELSVRAGLIARPDATRLKALLVRAGLPVTGPAVSPSG